VLNAFKNGDEKIPSAFSVVSLWTIVENASKSMRFSYENGLVWTGENKTKTLVWSKIFCFVFVFVSTGTFFRAFFASLAARKLERKRKNKTKQNKTKQNKTKQNKTKQNKTKQNKTKQNKTKTKSTKQGRGIHHSLLRRYFFSLFNLPECGNGSKYRIACMLRRLPFIPQCSM